MPSSPDTCFYWQSSYEKHVAERAAQGIVPKPIDAAQCAELVKALENPTKGEEDFLLDLFTNRVPPGVDEAAYVKASFLTAIVQGLCHHHRFRAPHLIPVLAPLMLQAQELR
jgi:aconitase B